MATTLNLKQAQACVKVVEILEQSCDYNTLVELQEVLIKDTDDLVNWLQDVIDEMQDAIYEKRKENM